MEPSSPVPEVSEVQSESRSRLESRSRSKSKRSERSTQSAERTPARSLERSPVQRLRQSGVARVPNRPSPVLGLRLVDKNSPADPPSFPPKKTAPQGHEGTVNTEGLAATADRVDMVGTTDTTSTVGTTARAGHSDHRVGDGVVPATPADMRGRPVRLRPETLVPPSSVAFLSWFKVTDRFRLLTLGPTLYTVSNLEALHNSIRTRAQSATRQGGRSTSRTTRTQPPFAMRPDMPNMDVLRKMADEIDAEQQQAVPSAPTMSEKEKMNNLFASFTREDLVRGTEAPRYVIVPAEPPPEEPTIIIDGHKYRRGVDNNEVRLSRVELEETRNTIKTLELKVHQFDQLIKSQPSLGAVGAVGAACTVDAVAPGLPGALESSMLAAPLDDGMVVPLTLEWFAELRDSIRTRDDAERCFDDIKAAARSLPKAVFQ